GGAAVGGWAGGEGFPVGGGRGPQRLHAGRRRSSGQGPARVRLPAARVKSQRRSVAMQKRQDLAFVYGTLMRGFPLHRLIEGRPEYRGRGTVAARLLDLGAAPAAVPEPHGTVLGEVDRLQDTGLWRVLDSVEGPQYHRGEVGVRMADDREVAAFMYWYVGPLGLGIPIPGGDYRAHAPARSIHRRS